MTLHKQAASLMILHAADVLQPLLILPYAGRVLGPSAFGQYAYTLALVQLANVVVDYGFYMTARRAAASVRDNPAAIRSLLAEVVAAKGVLCVAVALGASVIMGISEAIGPSVFLCILLATLGATFFPSWLFMALERPWQSAICVVTARFLALIAFFSLVKNPSQVDLASAIQASIPLVAAVVSLPFVLAIGLGGFKALRLGGVARQLKDGWRGFVSSLGVTAAIALPVPLVQHFSGFVAAGQYSIAEKLISAVRPVFRVISETLMPRVAYLAAHDPAKGLTLIWNSLWTLVVGGLLSLALYFLGPHVIILLFGSEFSGAIPLVHILYITPILLNISLCMSQLYMFNYGHERAWTALIVSGVITFLATSYLLSYWLDGATAVAIGFVAGEGLVAVISTGFFAISIIARNRSARISGTTDGSRAADA